MILGYSSLGELAFGELPGELSVQFTSPWIGEYAAAELDLRYVVRFNAPRAGSEFPYSLGERAFGEIDDNILDEQIHCATAPFDIDQDEIPSGRWYWNRVSELAIQQNIGAPMTGQTMSMGAVVELVNADEGLNFLLGERRLEGQPVCVFVGLPETPWLEFRIWFDGTIRHVGYTPQGLTLTIVDKSELFTATLQPENYTGAGGLNGGSDLTGQVKPVAFGSLRNVTPVIVDAANRIYQVHYRNINSVTAVRTAGVAWTFATDTTDIEAWTPVNNQYATDLSRGLVRLGSPTTNPDSTPTIDFTGDANGGYVTDARDVLIRMATDYAGMNPAKVKTNAETTADVGVYWPQTITCAQAMNEIAVSGDLYYAFESGGLFECRKRRDPQRDSADVTVTDNEVEQFTSNRTEGPAAVWKYRWVYNRNWTQQNPDSLDASVSLANRRAYQTDGDHSAIGNDAVLNWLPLAADTDVGVTLLTNEETDEWRDRLIRDSHVRSLVTISIYRKLHAIEPGNVITYAPDRLSGQKEFKGEVISITKNATAKNNQLTMISYDG